MDVGPPDAGSVDDPPIVGIDQDWCSAQEIGDNVIVRGPVRMWYHITRYSTVAAVKVPLMVWIASAMVMIRLPRSP